MILLPVEIKQARETKTAIRANFIFEKKLKLLDYDALMRFKVRSALSLNFKCKDKVFVNFIMLIKVILLSLNIFNFKDKVLSII
jgi:hypothetical protein